MDCIAPGLLPVKVEGDIQYGMNKAAGGWWLYLFNNKGVTKFADFSGDVRSEEAG